MTTASALSQHADEALPAPDHARLIEANINPSTGLATDYLNHFNEAVMMLDLLPTVPECLDDLMAWRPMSYREHFVATGQKHRDVVIAAYEYAEPRARARVDELAAAMNAILVSAREVLRLNAGGAEAAAMAQDTADQLKPLIARAGAIINGLDCADEAGSDGDAQAAIDALLER